MKKGLLFFLFIALVHAFGYAKGVRLGVINPTPSNLERVLYLVEKDYIDSDNITIIGIYHESQRKSMESTREFITKKGCTNVSVSVIKNPISMDSLFMHNGCTDEFKTIFHQTDGLIFFGGDDILPELYGEKTFLTTELIPQERNWEISFMYHLIGGNQYTEFTPFLAERPEFLILGICLGMQEMNVAAGGTLVQDIPYQIYKKTDYESVLEQDSEKQHKNYQKKVFYADQAYIIQFHPIRIELNSVLDMGGAQHPLVTSIHHQSVKKVGKNLKVIATSMDKKVIEAISHTIYPNVYGIQFHPELSNLYEQKEFINSRNEPVQWNESDRLFHVHLWKDFTNRLKASAAINP